MVKVLLMAFRGEGEGEKSSRDSQPQGYEPGSLTLNKGTPQ